MNGGRDRLRRSDLDIPGLRAEALARAFDASFTEARGRARAADRERFLALRGGDGIYALRVAEVDGVECDRRVVPLPSRVPGMGLLGLAGIRSMLVPVYDLGVLLGEERASSPRWIALSGRSEPIGLAFEALVGLVDVPRARIAPVEGVDHVHGRFAHLGVGCSIVELGSLRARIDSRAAQAARGGMR